MGIRAINWATRQRVGNATAKHALLWLAFHANEKSGECFPSVELLMEEMEVGSKNTVKAALKTLIDAGLISSKREMKGNRVSRTFYRLNLDGSISDPSNIDGSNIDADGSNFDGHGSISDRVMGQPLTPNKEVNKEVNKEENKEVLRAPAGAPQPPEMSDDEIADLLESVPQEKGERPPFEKGAHLSEKGDHPSPAPKRKRVSNVQKPESVSEQVWEDFSALRTKRRAPITETALKGIQREAEKAGITLEEALSTCCERGWQGFTAQWYRREKLEQKNASTAEYQLPSNDDWDNFDTAHYA